MDKQRTITIKIADHAYPVTIPAEEESATRECAEFLQKVVAEEYISKGRPFDDVLIFFALNVLRHNQILLKRLSTYEMEAAEWSRELKEYIAKAE